jgi:hypothetical protein
MSKKVSVTEPSPEILAVVLFEAFVAILNSVSKRVSGYYWKLNASSNDPEGLHHFLGVKCAELETILDGCGLRKGGTVSKKEAFDVGRRVGEAKSWKWSRKFEGEDVPRQEARWYLHLGQRSTEISKVGQQYSKGELTVVPSNLNRYMTRLSQDERDSMNCLIRRCQEIYNNKWNRETPLPPQDKPKEKTTKSLGDLTLKELDTLQVELENEFVDDLGVLFGATEDPSKRLRRQLQRQVVKYVRATLELMAIKASKVDPSRMNEVLAPVTSSHRATKDDQDHDDPNNETSTEEPSSSESFVSELKAIFSRDS